MGYMGFGMQKWIYTMRPRRPYSMQRKGSFTKVQHCYKTTKGAKQSDTVDVLILIAIVLIMIVSILVIHPRWMAYENNLDAYKNEVAISNNQFAFKFLMNSGRHRFLHQNYEGAYAEFKLAKAIYPNNPEVNNLLRKTLIKLCIQEKVYCSDLDELKL